MLTYLVALTDAPFINPFEACPVQNFTNCSHCMRLRQVFHWLGFLFWFLFSFSPRHQGFQCRGELGISSLLSSRCVVTQVLTYFPRGFNLEYKVDSSGSIGLCISLDLHHFGRSPMKIFLFGLLERGALGVTRLT